MEKKDITSREDIDLLIRTFYSKLEKDELIGFIFTEVTKLDFDIHIPVIVDFWESILLNNPIYKGNVMAEHIKLDKKVKLLPEHFDRWMELFLSTTNEYYEGTVTDDLIKRVDLMAKLMQFKVEQSRNPGFIV